MYDKNYTEITRELTKQYNEKPYYQPHVSTIEGFGSVFLSLKLYECKVPSNTNMKDLSIRFKVSFYITNSCTFRIKVNYKQGFSRPLVCR
jgi:hypothetical protein